MARARTIFACQACGFRSTRWLGRCPDCNEWNSLAEERLEPDTSARAAPSGERLNQPQPITELAAASETRRSSGIDELDRVLGGGVVPGSVVLIGGDPGIGKSTLVLQALAALAAGGRVLYVSGEESAQVRLRAERPGVAAARLLVRGETALEPSIAPGRAVAPIVIAIDSIQTMCTEELGSAAGSIGQVRESAGRLVQYAKGGATACF